MTNYSNSNVDVKSDFTEIDDEVSMLNTCVESSVGLSKLIIDPIISQQKIISNINSTLGLLSIDQSISDKLERLKTENSIENKISIILEANKLIEQDSKLFNYYRESFIKESKDVINSLDNKINSQKENISNILANKTEKLDLKGMSIKNKSKFFLINNVSYTHFSIL